jgi:hypothetical protein
MDAPEAGWRLQSKPGGSDHQDNGSGRKMALRIAGWPSGKKDEGPGGQKNGRGSKFAVWTAKTVAGSGKNAPGSPKFAPDAGFFDKRSPSGERFAGLSPWRVVFTPFCIQERWGCHERGDAFKVLRSYLPGSGRKSPGRVLPLGGESASRGNSQSSPQIAT